MMKTNKKYNKQVTLYSLLMSCMNYLLVAFVRKQHELKHMILYDKVMSYKVNSLHLPCCNMM